jgi:HSP20 family protein
MPLRKDVRKGFCRYVGSRTACTHVVLRRTSCAGAVAARAFRRRSIWNDPCSIHSTRLQTGENFEVTDKETSMANIAVQKETSPQDRAPSKVGREWDPFHTMRELMRWEPFPSMMSGYRAFEGATFSPDFEVKETKEAFVFSADMPGVKEGDIDVRLTQNRLTISGKRESEKTEKGDQYYTTERSYGSFTRAFTLPEGIESNKIHAELKQGVLTLVIPKKPEALPKKIEVSTR